MHKTKLKYTGDFIIVELEFRQRIRSKDSYRGKISALHTQCILTIDGFVVGVNTISKHIDDKNNKKYAFTNAARDVIKLIEEKEIREYFWKEIQKL